MAGSARGARGAKKGTPAAGRPARSRSAPGSTRAASHAPPSSAKPGQRRSAAAVDAPPVADPVMQVEPQSARNPTMSDANSPEPLKDAVRDMAAAASRAASAAADAVTSAVGGTTGASTAGADDASRLRSAVGATSRIVQQAATILEEEIAAGIVAAKRVEGRLVDVQKLRGADPQEVMQRFRRDAHEVVDILIDLVNVATNSLGGLAQRVVRIREGGGSADDGGKPRSPAGAVPSLNVPRPVRSGESVEVPLTLENDGDNPTDNFAFVCSDLVNPGGERIGGEFVSFAPTSLTIAPHSAATVMISVSVPAGTPPGTYSGILQATRMERVRAVLSVSIAQ